MALNEKVLALAAFEDAADTSATAQHLRHHEDGHSLEIRFAKIVVSVTKTDLHLSHVTGTHYWQTKNKVQLFMFLSEDVIVISCKFTEVMILICDNLVMVNTSHSQSSADFDTIMPCKYHRPQRSCQQCCWPLWQPRFDGLVDRLWN